METDTLWEDEAANRQCVRAALNDAEVADVAVFPELAFSGFTMEPRPDADAEPFLCALARERGQSLIAGYVGDGPANVAVGVDRGGEVLARYRKLHPFSYAGEDRHYRAGDELPVFELEGLRAAMLICYDLRFPEAFRHAATKGAQLFLVIANWPSPRIAHWRALLIARAVENQAYVVGVNRVGRDPNASYESSSMAVSPTGEVLHEGAGVVELDPAVVTQVREEFPFLKDIRPDLLR